MTSLQHHSHPLNHHNASTGNNNASNSLNVSLNNSSTNLSPVIQRKIETQLSNNSVNNNNFNRYSSGSGGTGITNQGPDFDTTSIASVSESSHWSGGGGDDLDNIALVNGSDCINTMENKDWSTYLKMAKNGYNSSDDDNTNNNGNSNSDGYNDDSQDENDEDLSLCDENVNSNRDLSKNKYNDRNESNMAKNNNQSNKKTSSRSNINSRKNFNKLNLTTEEFSKNPKGSQQHINKKSSKENYPSDQASKKKTNSNLESTNKKIKKKISQDSFESSNVHENEKMDGFNPSKTNSLSDEEADSSINANDNEFKLKQKYSIDQDKDNDEEIEIEESDEELDDVDDDEYDDEEEEDDDDDEEDDLDDDDIWTIKPKLYSYYEKQFKTMEPNLSGFITGSVAKPFFERSKLPLNELSKIWELSDVTKDGALSFAEFCTAMHLVVLRVRNFDLPNELPEKLQPYAPLIDFNTDATNNPILKVNEGSMLITSDSEDMHCSPTHQISRLTHGPGDESLVQFSLKPQIPNDIQIAHPVALRYNSTNQHQDTTQTGSIPEPPSRHSRSSSLGTINNPINANNQQQQYVVPPHLTVPNTPGSVAISNNLNTPKILQQQPVVPPRITSPPPVYHQQQSDTHQQSHQFPSGALLPPPPPPPLSHHQLHHHQNRLYHHQQHYPLSQQSSLAIQSNNRIPPPPPPNNEEIAKNIERLIEQMTTLNIERLKNMNERNQKQQSAIVESTSIPSTNTIDVDGLILSIRAQTEQNQLLRRVFNELEKELRALTDNRIALEIKLDYLNTTQSAQPTPNLNPATLNPNVNLSSTNTSGNGKKQPVPVTPIIASGNQQTNPSSTSGSSNANSNSNAANTPSMIVGGILNQTPTTKTNTSVHSKINI